MWADCSDEGVSNLCQVFDVKPGQTALQVRESVTGKLAFEPNRPGANPPSSCPCRCTSRCCTSAIR